MTAGKNKTKALVDLDPQSLWIIVERREENENKSVSDNASQVSGPKVRKSARNIHINGLQKTT